MLLSVCVCVQGGVAFGARTRLGRGELTRLPMLVHLIVIGPQRWSPCISSPFLQLSRPLLLVPLKANVAMSYYRPPCVAALDDGKQKELSKIKAKGDGLFAWGGATQPRGCPPINPGGSSKLESGLLV